MRKGEEGEKSERRQNLRGRERVGGQMRSVRHGREGQVQQPTLHHERAMYK